MPPPGVDEFTGCVVLGVTVDTDTGGCRMISVFVE